MSKSKDFWVLPDPHIGHQLIYKYRGMGFEEQMFSNVNKLPTNDILIILGDFIFKRSAYFLDKWLELVADRRVWLIRGNHDNESVTWYYNNGFCLVADEVKVKMFGINILLTHIPVCRDDYDVNCHAHTHGNTHRDGDNLLFDERNLSLDIENNGFNPIHLRSVVQGHIAKSCS